MKKSMKSVVSKTGTVISLLSFIAAIGSMMMFVVEGARIIKNEESILICLVDIICSNIGIGGALIALAASCVGLYAFPRVIIINEAGVTARMLFLKREVPWERIEEWGIGTSFLYGPSEKGRNALYFSTKKLSIKEKEEVAGHNRSILLLRPETEDTVFFVKYTAKRWTYVNSLEAVKAKKKLEIGKEDVS